MVAVAKKDIVLKVEKLKKAYGPVTIVEGFDLKVAAGEAVALTGRNGAGKSTVLRCLVGADRPDEGTVEVLGVKMKETSPEIRRNVATVIDDLDFFPDLSVVEHLDLLARAHGIADPDDLVDEILDEVQHDRQAITELRLESGPEPFDALDVEPLLRFVEDQQAPGPDEGGGQRQAPPLTG